ncbi:hypothetical protein [Shouchella patagoniensis]|nr:hypothetical protein [Shouchella patagoniensis]
MDGMFRRIDNKIGGRNVICYVKKYCKIEWSFGENDYDVIEEEEDGN